MEARVGGGSNGFYIAGMSNGLGKNSLEWDQNDWRWDSELFVATPLNAAPSNCRSKQLFPPSATATGGLSNGSSSCSDETDFRMNGKGKAEAEKRRRIIVEEEDGPYDEAGALTLKLGGHVFPIVEADLANWEGRNGVKRGKLQGGSLNRATCQVEGCGADLSHAKDYHRRHKVCEMHAKASRAMVGNVMQRFCQQCSRFHLLQEFDEGKRSCRRRLAGHNRRRRKTNPDASPNGISLTDDQASSYLLITLLRILSNLHSEGSDQAKDQDLLPSLLRNIASLAGSSDASTLSRLLQASQDMRKLGTSDGTSSEAANPLLSNGAAAQEFSRPCCSPSKMSSIAGTQGPSVRPIDNSVSVALARVEMPSERNAMEASLGGVVRAVPSQRSASLVPVEEVLSVRADAICSLQYGLQEESLVESARLKDFDLNNTYNDAQDCVACEQSAVPGTVGTGSPDCPSWILQDSHQSSPPQTSGNSDSTSGQSLSNSNGDTQSRTDRIVFKLFGKDPNDFPLSLRGQILDWLSHSPTDMESYIRPGCIILTIYLCLAESEWEDLSCDLSSSLSRLLHAPGVDFWRTGWICARIQHRIAFIYNGQVLLDSPLLLKGPDHCSILSITPIAVSISARVNFKVKGFNLVRSTARLLCAFEGRYVIPETPEPLVEDNNTNEHDGSQCCSFYCSVPNSIGRGFIEVEDNGLSSGFFPFLVAEENVCSEIRMLESIIEVPSCDDIFEGESDAKYARNQAIDFLHEMGWLLRKSQLRSGSDQMNSHANLFPLNRFKWLMVFAMDREWCAVVKKLLDILFEGIIVLGGHSPVELALSEDLLHTAVRKNCKSMVELLLRYKPDKETDPDNFLFKPDMLSSANITPLHIAACSSGAEGVLEALTDDPAQLGIKAWNSARDITGFTPEDYARSRGFSSYLDLVQKKITKKLDKGHVVLDIPGNLLAPGSALKQPGGTNPSKLPRFQIDESKLRSLQQPCCLCDQQLVQRGFGRRSLLYRPVMLSMVGIAAVCVCVGLLLKGPPEVLFVDNPFRWESLEYGWI